MLRISWNNSRLPCVYDSLLDGESSKRCRPRDLLPEDEFFLVLVRLRLGVMEQDLADRFEISQSTTSRIICTWIYFLYLKFKEIPLWPPRDLVLANMLRQFKEKYPWPSTRVIIDATEIFISQPRLPELQQMTFSNYKNHKTFKALVAFHLVEQLRLCQSFLLALYQIKS